MAKGDTKTNQYLDIAANGTRADLPTDTCCETRSQTLIREVAERIITEEETRYREDQILQSEIDEIKNNPDIYDIVATYADLQNYDTSTITDKDVIRVLRDETHDNASTYYRWDAADQEFDYIGETGDYYTKAQVNAFLALKADKATTYTKTETDALLDGKQDVLTAGENITIVDESGSLVISAEGGGGSGVVELTSADYDWPTNNPNGVALWLLEPGTYHAAAGVGYYTAGVGGSVFTDGASFIVNDLQSSSTGIVQIKANTMYYGVIDKATGAIITAYTRLTTPVVQTTGTSTTDVMSQNAVSSMVFADPGSALGSNQKIRIGEGATVSGNRGVAIGAYSSGSGYRSVALGDSASATGRSSVALAYSNANSKGEFAIGVSGTEGYNSSAYRLISGVYDGQNAHDAATKGQLDSIAIQNAGAPTTATTGTVGQLLEDTTNGKLYICTDTTGGSYTWAEVGAGGSGGAVVELTSADYNWNSTAWDDTTTPFDSIALWKLAPGMYTAETEPNIAYYYHSQNLGQYGPAYPDSLFLVGGKDPDNYNIVVEFSWGSTGGNILGDGQPGTMIVYQYNDAQGGNTNGYPKNSSAGGSITPVQTTGTSTTDVMSQKAVTDTLFAKNNNTLIWIGPDNYQNKQSCNSPSGLVLGSGLTALNNDAFEFITVSFSGNPKPARHVINLMGSSPLAIGGISIGKYSHAKGQSSIALGTGAATKVTTANSNNSVAIGASAYADGTCSVALGAGAYAYGVGVMDVGTSRISNTAGYNSSAYRLLTGLYDPQNAHDAATKGYVDPTADSSAPTTATVGRLGQIQIDTTTATAYMCVEVDSATPSYTWKQITA